VRIGKGCVIGPGTFILENSILESNVVVGAGSVIGSVAGFTYADGEKTIDVVSSAGVDCCEKLEGEQKTKKVTKREFWLFSFFHLFDT
jgi:serine acetyltransferase